MELLSTAIKKVGELDQSKILAPKTNNSISTSIKKFYCIIDYNPTNPNIPGIITKAMSYCERSSSTRALMNTEVIFGYRKPKNLSDYLVRTKLPTIKKPSFPPRCNRFLRCRHCVHIMNKSRTRITSYSTGRSYKIPRKVTCNSSNLIYCLECPDCNIQYVGQTKNKLLIRMNQHRNDIKHKWDTSVSRHYNSHVNEFRIYVLQLVNSDEQSARDLNENYWISRLHTISPKGLNLLD